MKAKYLFINTPPPPPNYIVVYMGTPIICVYTCAKMSKLIGNETNTDRTISDEVIQKCLVFKELGGSAQYCHQSNG